MKVLTALIVVILALSAMVASSCSSADPGSSTAKRLTIAEAEALVRADMFDRNPDMNPSAEFPLEERTTAEIWSRLHIQVFSLPDDHFLGPVTLAIARERVDWLGTAFGGFGVTDMCVTDLDGDGHPELTYAYSWGSGIHRGLVAVYIPDAGSPQMADATEACWNGDFLLEKVNDQRVIVRESFRWGPDGPDRSDARAVGELSLGIKDGKPELSIQGYQDGLSILAPR